MKVALYARVSTSEEQDPETQLMPLREFCAVQGWKVYQEYVDRAPSRRHRRHRTIQWEWSPVLLDEVAKRRFKAVLVFKLDRAFRSVKHMHDTLAAWEMSGVSFQSVKDQFDTSTAIGRLLMNLLAAGWPSSSWS